jgi:hypothetical protein
MREYRGVFLVGDKPSNRIWAIKVVNDEDALIFLSPTDYRNNNVVPTDYSNLPWEEDVKLKVAQP